MKQTEQLPTKELVSRLRDSRFIGQEDMREEAAREIERLEREVQEWKNWLAGVCI